MTFNVDIFYKFILGFLFILFYMVSIADLSYILELKCHLCTMTQTYFSSPNNLCFRSFFQLTMPISQRHPNVNIPKCEFIFSPKLG